MKKRFLGSTCGRAWLFDVDVEEKRIQAGLACVLPGSGITVDFEANGGASSLEHTDA